MIRRTVRIRERRRMSHYRSLEVARRGSGAALLLALGRTVARARRGYARAAASAAVAAAVADEAL